MSGVVKKITKRRRTENTWLTNHWVFDMHGYSHNGENKIVDHLKTKTGC